MFLLFKAISNVDIHLKFFLYLLRDTELRERHEIEKCGGRQKYYTEKARRIAKSCDENLRVNFNSSFGGEGHFGNNCNFNGKISIIAV